MLSPNLEVFPSEISMRLTVVCSTENNHRGKEILNVTGIASVKMTAEEHARGLPDEIASYIKYDNSTFGLHVRVLGFLKKWRI